MHSPLLSLTYSGTQTQIPAEVEVLSCWQSSFSGHEIFAIVQLLFWRMLPKINLDNFRKWKLYNKYESITTKN